MQDEWATAERRSHCSWLPQQTCSLALADAPQDFDRHTAQFAVRGLSVLLTGTLCMTTVFDHVHDGSMIWLASFCRGNKRMKRLHVSVEGPTISKHASTSTFTCVGG